MLFALSLGVLCVSVASSPEEGKAKTEAYSFEPGVPASPATAPAVKAVAIIRPFKDSTLFPLRKPKKSGFKKLTFSEDVRRRLRDAAAG